ncbi:MAG: glucuronate isomerase [Oscillospiraceae bacterium]|nr:glucuronate isomerase [Oscillospiraceae bacterium]
MKSTYLLSNKTAKRLYLKAKNLPIIDYHCHISPKEIFEDKPYTDIGKIWLSEDHYKWRLMRTAGIDEEYITGSAPYKEKFIKYCSAIEFAAGNPLYHWSHMELSRFFGIETTITEANAEKIWDEANAYIAKTKMSPRKLIESSNVEVLCTTDDLTDDLSWHKKIAEDKTFAKKVLPSFRADNLLLVRRNNYLEYIDTLRAVSGVTIASLADLKEAISKRLDFFCSMGCRCADIGMPLFPNRIANDEEGDSIFKNLLAGESITDDQYSGFVGNIYLFLGKLYKEKDLISQWHISVVRNPNSIFFEKLGGDLGFDCVGNPINGNDIIMMLDAINRNSGVPKTVIYSLNEANIAQLASIAGSFPNVKCGAAWWFCDHKRGIEDEIRVISEYGCLGEFYGMLTDSRCLLSYARHDYFRRILCNIIGEWVEKGEFSPLSAEKLISKICYENIKNAI